VYSRIFSKSTIDLRTGSSAILELTSDSAVRARVSLISVSYGFEVSCFVLHVMSRYRQRNRFNQVRNPLFLFLQKET